MSKPRDLHENILQALQAVFSDLEHDVFRRKHIMLLSYYYRMLFCEKPDSTFSQHALKHFQAKHVPAKAGMGTGSREENAINNKNREHPISFIQIEFRSSAGRPEGQAGRPDRSAR
ncbi:MAG: hypothetical protein IOC49_11825 [Methylobacterium sp.]|nr:hypothetical protein [Methylobacterium sp.]